MIMTQVEDALRDRVDKFETKVGQLMLMRIISCVAILRRLKNYPPKKYSKIKTKFPLQL